MWISFLFSLFFLDSLFFSAFLHVFACGFFKQLLHFNPNIFLPLLNRVPNEYAYMITTETGFSYQLRLGCCCCCCPVSSDPPPLSLSGRKNGKRKGKQKRLAPRVGRLTMSVEMLLLLMLVRARCVVLSLDCAINLTSIRFPLNRLFVCVWFVVWIYIKVIFPFFAGVLVKITNHCMYT